MRVAFRALDGGFVADDSALACGVGGIDADGVEHYLTLQGPTESSGDVDDPRVYVEFDDQINSGYDRVLACRVRPARLSLDLRAQLGSLADIDGFDVTLELERDVYDDIRNGLVRIFRYAPEALSVSA